MLAITDADRSLAFELGLYLIKLPETEADRAHASRRVPEHWQVKRVIDHQVVGLIHLTPVDSLYVTKESTATSSIEESIADALCWLSPTLRHVRTGEYDGIESVFVLHAGEMRVRPRAITVCGARSTSADYDPIAAESARINGRAHEVCPACQATCSGRTGGSTAKQRNLIRRLLAQGARYGRDDLIDIRSIDQMTRSEASAAIDALKSLQERGWRGKL